MTGLTKWAALLLLALVCSCSDNASNQQVGAPAPLLAEESAPSLRILVIGGTSGIGLQTVMLALERGHQVTALARRPERMTYNHPQLNTVRGDILDAQAMAAAIDNQDAIVIAIGMGPTRAAVDLFSQGTRNVLAGMQATGVQRLIAVTGIGAGETRGHGGFFYDKILFPLALRTIYEDKDRMESLIRESDASTIAWSIVRPGFLTDHPATNRYRVISDVKGVTAGEITRADVAHFIIALIESNTHIGASPLISE